MTSLSMVYDLCQNTQPLILRSSSIFSTLVNFFQLSEKDRAYFYAYQNTTLKMDQATQTMIENLKKNTGKSLEDWIAIVKKTNLEKHGEIVKYLKETHDFGHGYANLVSMMAREPQVLSNPDDSLVDAQYKGKESLRPIYEAIVKHVKTFGKDVEVAPKKTSVSLRRKRQFALIQPSTKTRIDLGLKFNSKPVKGRLESSGPFGAMCTHRVQLTDVKQLDKEVLEWIKEAYGEAG